MNRRTGSWSIECSRLRSSWCERDAYVGEGPVWDPRVGRLLWVDIPNGSVFLTDPADGATVERRLPLAVGIVLPRASGGYVAALQDGFYALSDEGEPELIAPVEAADQVDPLQRRRDGPPGTVLGGHHGLARRAGPGLALRLHPDGTVTRMIPGVSISNGLGWSPDGRTMYYVDTPTLIDQLRFRPGHRESITAASS